MTLSMKIRAKAGVVTFVCCWIASSVGAQAGDAGKPAGPAAQKQSVAFPIIPPTRGPMPPSAASLECVVTFGPPCPITALAFSPDGKTLAVGGYQEVLFWDLTEPKLAKRIAVNQSGNAIHALVFSKDGKLLLVGEGTPYGPGAVKAFDVETGEPAFTFQEFKDVVYALAISPDGKLLAAGCGDGCAYVWSLEEKKLVTTLKDHNGWVLGVSFSADGKLLATASADRTAEIWQVETWKSVNKLMQKESVYGAVFTPDGNALALAVGGPTDRAIRFRRKDDGQEFRVMETSPAMPLDIVWAPPPPKTNAPRLFVPCTDKTVRMLNANGGQTASLAGHEDWVYRVATSADGTRLASGSADGTVKLWTLAGPGAPEQRLLATFVQLAPGADGWLAIVPQGYFAASSADAVGWKTANLATPPEKLTELFQNAEMVRDAIAATKKIATPAVK
jgi:dipeptidyl aminopeptidase/acylaminoacyl peptidase